MINDYLTKFPTSNIEKAREFQRNVYFCFIDYTITLKLNIQKIKIMASGPITSWQIDGETMETGRDFILGGSNIIADSD